MDTGATSWLWSAERLLYGGQQLWRLASEAWEDGFKDREHHPAAPGQIHVAFLLFGYAIENATKGLLAQKGAGVPMNHDLAAHAVQAGVWNDLSGEERQLLARLGEHIRWAGRYPIPHPKVAAAVPPGHIMPHSEIHPDTDADLVRELFETLSRKYDPPVRKVDGNLTR